MNGQHSFHRENAQQAAHYAKKSTDFSVAYTTNIGARKENQDSCSVCTASDGTCIFSVADGLGGHVGGRTASQIAIRAITDYAETATFDYYHEQTMRQMFATANEQIILAQQKNPSLSSMRSTLVILMIKDNLAFWGHVGDVRLYHIRQQKIHFQTLDHSVPQMLVGMDEIKPEDIRKHPERNRLLKALGNRDLKLQISAPSRYQQLQQGDYFHLATDGFWEWLVEDELINFLKSHKDLAEASLVMERHVAKHAIKDKKNFDNFTALTVSINQAQLNSDYWHKTHFIKKQGNNDANHSN